MSTDAMLRIGELAESGGVSVSAVRFYEGKGLLDADARVAGQRRYAPAAVKRLRLVVTMRQAGLSVSDIAHALDRSPGTGAARREKAAQRAVELRQQVELALSALVIVDHAAHCHREADDDRCMEEIAERRDLALQQAQHLLGRIVRG